MKFKKLCIVFFLCIIGVSDTSPVKKQLKATIISNPTAESFTVVVKNLGDNKKISQATFTKEATGPGKKLYYDFGEKNDGTNIVSVYRGKKVQEKYLLYTENITKEDARGAFSLSKDAAIIIDAAKYLKDTTTTKSYLAPREQKRLYVEVRNPPANYKGDAAFVITPFSSKDNDREDKAQKTIKNGGYMTFKFIKGAPVKFSIIRAGNKVKDQAVWTRDYNADEINKAKKLIISFPEDGQTLHNMSIKKTLDQYVYLEDATQTKV